MPEYDTITVPAGETNQRVVRSGETFANYLIDISADGAHFDLDVRGAGWEVRNVGVSGKDGSDEKDQIVHVKSDGDGVLENVYLGDGQIDDGVHNTGLFVNRLSKGVITIRRLHVSGFADNGVYASACNRSDRSHGGATVIIEDSFGHNNNTANFRVSGNAVLRNTTSVCNGPVPGKPNNQGQVNYNCRPVWIKELADVTIEGCNLDSSHTHGASCVMVQDSDGGRGRRATVRDTSWGPDGKRYYVKHSDDRIDHEGNGNDTHPDVSPPAGVPLSALEAASSGRNGPGSE